MSKKNFDDLIGKKFGRLTVKEIIYVKNSHTKAKLKEMESRDE